LSREQSVLYQTETINRKSQKYGAWYVTTTIPGISTYTRRADIAAQLKPNLGTGIPSIPGELSLQEFSHFSAIVLMGESHAAGPNIQRRSSLVRKYGHL
jgi:hypothetical protein